MEAPLSCSACHRDVRIAARGLCSACYQRWQKRGSTDYVERRRGVCQIPDCGKPLVSNGLCDMHRQRLRKHGHLEQTRPDDWGSKKMDGKKKPHPLYYSWAWLRRYRTVQPVCDAWLADFLQFVADVGQRPSPKHKLFSADPAKPIGPDNFIWKTSVTQKVEGETPEAYKRRYAKIYRALRPEYGESVDLKRNYGITRSDYKEMLEKQKGVCAICGLAESRAINGSVLRLAVDHCHTTGAVRGLLCSQCNQGLGHFRDSTELMREAIAYLEKATLQQPPI